MRSSALLGFAVGPVVSVLLGIITLPLLAAHIPTEGVAKFALLQVSLNLGILISCLGVDQSFVRFFHESRDRAQLLRTALAPVQMMSLILLALIFCLRKPLMTSVFEIESELPMILLAISIVFASVSRMQLMAVRMSEGGWLFSSITLAPKLVLMLGLFVVAAGFYPGDFQTLTYLVFFGSVSAVVISTGALSILGIEIVGGSQKSERIFGQKLADMVAFGLPLLGSSVFLWALISLDRIFLKFLSTDVALAQYTIAAGFAAVGNLVQSIFSVVWAPIVYKWIAQGDPLDKLTNVQGKVCLLIVIFYCGIGVFAKLVTIVLPEQYDEVPGLIVCCVAYPLFYTLSETTVVGINVSKRTSLSFIASGIALTIYVCLNWLLIPHYGAAGAAVSLVIAFWVFLVARTEMGSFVWRDIPRGTIYLLTILCVFLSTLGVLAPTKVQAHIPFAWLALGILGVYLYRKFAKELVREFCGFFR